MLVASHRQDSDHFLICTTLNLPLTKRTHAPLDGITLHPLKWRPFCQAQYSQAIREDSGRHLELCKTAIEAGDLKGSIHHLYQLVEGAALQAGMKRNTPKAHSRRNPSMPFFDEECHAMKRQVWCQGQTSGWKGDEFRRLERQYHALVRRKKRATSLRAYGVAYNRRS
jgi:hypothetical protein